MKITYPSLSLILMAYTGSSIPKPRKSIKELGLDTLLPPIVNNIPGYYEPSLEPKELGSVVVTLGGPDIWPITHVITSSRNSALLLSSNICINI